MLVAFLGGSCLDLSGASSDSSTATGSTGGTGALRARQRASRMAVPSPARFGSAALALWIREVFLGQASFRSTKRVPFRPLLRVGTTRSQDLAHQVRKPLGLSDVAADFGRAAEVGREKYS